MTIDELYGKYDGVVGNGGLNVTPTDHFVFDLTDDNSQGSLKTAFPGIESVLMPECGKYLVAAPIVENPDMLVLMFPQETDGNMGLWAFNTKSHKGCELSSEVKATIDNFKNDFANMAEIATRFNEFAFGDGGENSTIEVKDIGSFEVSNDEPVEIPNNTDNDEETTMKFKPIEEDTELNSELKDTKWVEIPNTTAHGVTVTEDGEEAAGADDPFADAGAELADTGDATADAGTPDAGTTDATADAGTEGAAATGDDTTADATTEEAPVEEEDPKQKMRDLLAYYTNYMNELVQDPNTSTELISATQEMIDSLISNMESADAIEEVKAETEEAAKEEVSAEEAPAEETPAEGDAGAEATPVEGDAATTEEPVAEATDDEVNAKIDAEVDDLHKDDWQAIEPVASDDILTPGDLRNSAVNDVDLTGATPTPDEELAATAPDMAAPAPTSDVLDDTELPSPDEEVDLLGPTDDMEFGADGLPMDKYEGDIDALATSPVAKKINWSTDYATNGMATSDDNTVVVPEVLTELSDYYKKVADEVSKVPGKEDVAMKLQKIQILTQTIQNEWNGITAQIGDSVANSYDLSNMGDLEKDELASQDAMGMVGADVMADQEQEEEDDLAINNQIAAFCESYKYLM